MKACCKQAPDRSKHHTEGNRANDRTHPAAVKQRSIPHVLLDVARIFFDDGTIFQLAYVVEDVSELYLPESLQHGAVRIAFLIREHVMLAVYGNPLGRHDPRCQPDVEPEQP